MADPLSIFSALGDATRLRILQLVRAMELSVGELAQVLEQSQPRVSRHVRILGDAGLVERRREGSWVFVALGAAAVVGPVLRATDGWEEERGGAEGGGEGDPIAAADRGKLHAVREERARAAAAWFESHAGEWDRLRQLHVADDEVEAAMAAMLGDAPARLLVDIGTGTGRMLELFGDRAADALGIDRSSEMLRLARVKLHGRTNVELRQADLHRLPLPAGAADVAILHQVLHYAEAPDVAIGEAARVLGPGGRLLVADFAPHGREELRSRDNHARLGFSDEQVAGWFAAAGLDRVRIETLAGSELTVKLWLGCKPGRTLREVKAA